MNNTKNLPVAVFREDGRLSNLEILNWIDVGNGKMDGRNLVWVEKNDAISFLGSDDFEPKQVWGEMRLGVSKVNGRLGPMVCDPPQSEDRRYIIHE